MSRAREEIALAKAVVERLVPAGRERSLAITKLDEASLWVGEAERISAELDAIGLPTDGRGSE